MATKGTFFQNVLVPKCSVTAAITYVGKALTWADTVVSQRPPSSLQILLNLMRSSRKKTTGNIQ
eukprot:590216-Amphidinium_carterae.1